ncbi:hypothetical protein Btru_066337 [Bulinus truncatus]|nr:hypothetical protein Btru_066337 [Bulinus truncatus]
MFSDPQQLLPLITWTQDDGTMIHNSNKYVVSQDGRSLTIYNLQETDERNYYCKAKNTIGPPIFYEDKAPRDMAVIEGKSAFIPCEARSAFNDINPSPPPIWYINGVQTGLHTDRAKYDIKLNSLEIKAMRKTEDIQCVQCLVTNSEGELMGEACVNVICQDLQNDIYIMGLGLMVAEI